MPRNSSLILSNKSGTNSALKSSNNNIVGDRSTNGLGSCSKNDVAHTNNVDKKEVNSPSKNLNIKDHSTNDFSSKNVIGKPNPVIIDDVGNSSKNNIGKPNSVSKNDVGDPNNNIENHSSKRVSTNEEGRLNKTNERRQSAKKLHRKGRNEYHCLDDVCILVRVPSSSTYISRLSVIRPTNVSDESLKAYAKQAEERDARKGRSSSFSNSSDSVVRYDEYEYNDTEDEIDDYYPQEQKDESEMGFISIEDCTEFMDHITFAKEFVKRVISESEAKVEARTPPPPPVTEQEDKEEEENYFMGNFRESTEFSYIETKRSFTSWPTIETFTIETGAYKIDEYLASFETEEDWMYVIYYQGTQKKLCSDCYKYQAIFSLPTWRYPIAQATVSMYFIIEVCKAKPQHCLVDVTYRYESFGHRRKPGVVDFQEKWLHFILDSKFNLLHK